MSSDNRRAFDSTDRAILEFERLHWAESGNKQAEILDRFAMRAPRYYQLLNWIIDQPEALAYDAQLVNRLRDRRDLRRAVRTRGTTAAGVPTRTDIRGVRPALLGGVV